MEKKPICQVCGDAEGRPFTTRDVRTPVEAAREHEDEAPRHVHVSVGMAIEGSAAGSVPCLCGPCASRVLNAVNARALSSFLRLFEPPTEA